MPPKKMGDLITRYWLSVAILIVICVALLAPGMAVWFTRFHIIDGGIMVIMFIGSLKLAPSRFRAAIARPKLIIFSALSVFVVAPLFSIFLAALLGFDQDADRLGVLICSAQASTLATAIVLTEVAGGDVALAMVLTVVNNLIAVVATPLVFRFLGSADITVDHTAMIWEMVLKILFPVLVGQALRPISIQMLKPHLKKLSILSQLIILCFIYLGVVAGAERLFDQQQAIVELILLVLLLHPCLLVVNGLIARFSSNDPGSRTAFVLCSSQKTLPAAILIWKNYFAAISLGPLIAVAYHVLQLIIDSILAPGFCRLPLIRNRQKSSSGH